MARKVIGVRLGEGAIEKLSDYGKPYEANLSDVIRACVLMGLDHPDALKKTIEKLKTPKEIV